MMSKKTCSYKKKTAEENVFEAHPTTERLESGSTYIRTHSAIIKVGKLIKTSERIKSFPGTYSIACNKFKID